MCAEIKFVQRPALVLVENDVGELVTMPTDQLELLTSLARRLNIDISTLRKKQNAGKLDTVKMGWRVYVVMNAKTQAELDITLGSAAHHRRTASQMAKIRRAKKEIKKRIARRAWLNRPDLDQADKELLKQLHF